MKKWKVFLKKNSSGRKKCILLLKKIHRYLPKVVHSNLLKTIHCYLRKNVHCKLPFTIFCLFISYHQYYTLIKLKSSLFKAGFWLFEEYTTTIPCPPGKFLYKIVRHPMRFLINRKTSATTPFPTSKHM